ncbi:MAG: hypothetical protein RR942_06865 [Romboutsia sp.]
MNRKLSISVLGITIASLVVLGVCTIVNQPKYKVIDIKGDKSELGEVSFITQSYEGLYSNTQTTTSKDGFEVNKYSNEIKQPNQYYDLINGNKDIFKYGYTENLVYGDSNNVGYLEELGVNYINSEKATLDFRIVNKNIKTKKINEYNLTLPDTFDSDTNFEHGFIIGIKDEDVYILCSGSTDLEHSKNGQIKDNKGIFMNVYKFNLNTKQLKKQSSMEKNSSNNELIIINNQISFENNGKLYTIVESYPKQDEKSGKIYLVYYDINRNKFDYIKEPLITNIESESCQNIKYNIEDDKLYLMTQHDIDWKNTNINQYVVDLNSNKVIDVNKNYNVEKLNKSARIENFRVIDEKIYICMDNYNIHDEQSNNSNKHKNTIIVIDEKSNRVIYMGEYINYKAQRANNIILKNNEI